jgi:hypothetical protein
VQQKNFGDLNHSKEKKASENFKSILNSQTVRVLFVFVGKWKTLRNDPSHLEKKP